MEKRNVVLATHNMGKLWEFQAFLAQLPIQLVATTEYSVPSVKETGLSFVENALLKARNAALYTGLPALADDSGLEVDVLKGAPGIYSSRFAGGHASVKQNNEKLLESLLEVDDEKRTARFVCVLVFMEHAKDPTPIICQGVWEGKIMREPKGINGFGYDPLFWVPTHECTAAELPTEVKNTISHRGLALQRFVKSYTENHSL